MGTDENLARVDVIMHLLSAAGEDGRAAAIESLERSIADWETRPGCEWVIADKRRAIDIIRNRTIAAGDVFTRLE